MPTPTTLTVHGVLMEICGLGVLIRGQSGIGKGELALELISRGYYLIADDVPQLSCSVPQGLSGTCPPLLRNLLEVRGLGVLNVAALFGEQAVADSTLLKLIVTLETLAESETSERGVAGPGYHSCELLGVEVPEVRLVLRPGRHLALLVETLVKNFRLQLQGYLSHTDLNERQRRAIDQSC